MAILIIAQEGDPHAQAVAAEIVTQGGEPVILDLSRFPIDVQLNVRYSCCGKRKYELMAAGRLIDFSVFRSAWWRRPQHPQISTEIASDTHRLFAANECAEALAGVWHSLDVFWVNDPARDHVAHRKITQLRAAQECGLRVPDTLITNDPDQARRFVDRLGYRNVVYKAFSALQQAWRETRVFRPEELPLLDRVKYAPVIFQEYIEALYDVRITVVGESIFAAAIHSQETSYPTDFRMDMANAEITVVDLPPDLTAKLLMYMRTLGLEYGAIDMRRTADEEYVFLEINPAGQWLFVEQKTHQPIAAALASLLLRHDNAVQATTDGVRFDSRSDSSVADLRLLWQL